MHIPDAYTDGDHAYFSGFKFPTTKGHIRIFVKASLDINATEDIYRAMSQYDDIDNRNLLYLTTYSGQLHLNFFVRKNATTNLFLQSGNVWSNWNNSDWNQIDFVLDNTAAHDNPITYVFLNQTRIAYGAGAPADLTNSIYFGNRPSPANTGTSKFSGYFAAISSWIGDDITVPTVTTCPAQTEETPDYAEGKTLPNGTRGKVMFPGESPTTPGEGCTVEYAKKVIDSSLILQMKFEENLTDSTGKNSITGVGSPTFVDAKFLKGVLLGSGKYLTVPNSSDFAYGSNNFGYSLWFYLNTLPANGKYYIFDSKYIDTNNYFLFGIYNNSGTYRLSLLQLVGGSYEVQYVQDIPSLSSSTIYHLAFSRIESTFEGWLNATSLGTLTNSNSLTNLSAVKHIGWANTAFSTIEYLDGCLDDYLTFNGKGFTSDQVSAIVNSTKAYSSSCVEKFTMDSCGNENQNSNHVPLNAVPKDAGFNFEGENYPQVTQQKNVVTGVQTFYHFSRMAKLLQELFKKEKLLPENENIIYEIFHKDDAQLEAEDVPTHLKGSWVEERKEVVKQNIKTKK